MLTQKYRRLNIMTLLYTTILSLSLSFVAWMNLPQNYKRGLAAHQAGDYNTALKEWRPLAEQGNAITQYNLALMYKNGEGIAEDNVEAVKWYKRAAEQGYASAQNNLGNMYYNGEGCLLYTSPSPRDLSTSRMPSSA